MGGARQNQTAPWTPTALPLIALLAVAIAAAFVPSIRAPFLFDDYRHLLFAANETWLGLLNRVVLHHPTGGDLFFRPLGDFVFLWIYPWGHFDFHRWHVPGVALHVANTVLVMLLAKRICGGWLGGMMAGLFFGWHAAHVEAVTWVSALYDLLAALFVLLALLEIMSRRGTLWRYVGLLLYGLLACMSKESAYCLPLLAAVLVGFVPADERRLAWKKVAFLGLACFGVFVFRYWYLGGLGGYQANSGGAMAAHFQVLSTIQAMGLRLWALLFVPVNWSIAPGLVIKVAFTCMAIALVGFAWAGKLKVRRAGLIGLFVIMAALPVVTLLLIGYDLSGARVLYLPSVGAALLWAEIAESVPNRKLAGVLCALFLMFSLAALEHNQAVWVSVAEESRQACTEAGSVLRNDPKATLFGFDLPRTKNGVYFLRNAFPYCVAVNGGVEDRRITVGDRRPGSSARMNRWRFGRRRWMFGHPGARSR